MNIIVSYEKQARLLGIFLVKLIQNFHYFIRQEVGLGSPAEGSRVAAASASTSGCSFISDIAGVELKKIVCHIPKAMCL